MTLPEDPAFFPWLEILNPKDDILHENWENHLEEPVHDLSFTSAVGHELQTPYQPVGFLISPLSNLSSSPVVPVESVSLLSTISRQRQPLDLGSTSVDNDIDAGQFYDNLVSFPQARDDQELNREIYKILEEEHGTRPLLIDRIASPVDKYDNNRDGFGDTPQAENGPLMSGNLPIVQAGSVTHVVKRKRVNTAKYDNATELPCSKTTYWDDYSGHIRRNDGELDLKHIRSLQQHSLLSYAGFGRRAEEIDAFMRNVFTTGMRNESSTSEYLDRRYHDVCLLCKIR